MTKADKPLGCKAYGHIPHLPSSRLGPGDHKCHEGQARIATEKVRDKHDRVIVQEKLDGSCVAVARIGNDIFPLGRAGYVACTSRFEQHQLFWAWAQERRERFLALLHDGERVVGEWLAQAHGTRYELAFNEPFVAFDLMRKHERTPLDEFDRRVREVGLTPPPLIHWGGALSIKEAMFVLGTYGCYGALDAVEGIVWRVERNKQVKRGHKERHWVADFLVKYVRPDKVDGRYLPEVSGKDAVWNWRPR